MDRTRAHVIIPGFHAVKESLLNRASTVYEIWIEEGKRGSRADEVLRLAESRSVAAVIKNKEAIEILAPGIKHQGVLAFAETYGYVEFDKLLNRPADLEGCRLLLATDHITDEGNLGALMRTAAFFGVEGLILPKDRSAQVTGRLLKRTSGAFVYLPVARVVNLRRALDTLRKRGFWIIGAAGEGLQSLYDFDWNRDTVLVLGNESKGLSLAVRDRCDDLVKIPGEGRVESLNVSVAGGIILAEIMRHRLMGKP